MNAQEAPGPNIREAIITAVRAIKPIEVREVSDDEDMFGALGLNSMDAFRVLVHLERALDITIGEQPTDFDRIRTFAGLNQLLIEKVQGRATPT